MAHAQANLVHLLDELCSAVEELLLAGLTAASKSTLERLDVTFKEASRLKLLRLGGNLRIANEEIARFTAGSQQFSARRFSFFLGRTWVLARGMRRALKEGDDALFDRLMAAPQAQPVEKLRVVVLGVTKLFVPGTFASFEFRLRAIEQSGRVAFKEPLIWSWTYPVPKDRDLPAEACLHLPLRQKFKASMLLERKIIEIHRSSIVRQGGSAAKILLGDDSRLMHAGDFHGWGDLWKWDQADALRRLEGYSATPLDLDTELQEEAFLTEWQPRKKYSFEGSYDVLPIVSGGLHFEGRLDLGPSGDPLRNTMLKLVGKAAKVRPPLFGIVFYESSRLVLHPLSLLRDAGPEYLTLSADKVSMESLVRSMKFT